MSAADDRWWALIDRTRLGTRDPDEHADRLTEALAALTPDEIVDFDCFVGERIRDAYRWDLWAVAYIMNGGCSADGFDYFLGWLIGSGRKRYEAALANPEAAAAGISADDEPFENESIGYAARQAWEEKTGRSDFEAVAPRVPRQLIGEKFDEDTVDQRHPKLAKRFGG